MKTKKKTEAKREAFENMAEELYEQSREKKEVKRIYVVYENQLYSEEVTETKRIFILKNSTVPFRFYVRVSKGKYHTNKEDAIKAAIEKEELYVRAYERKVRNSRSNLKKLKALFDKNSKTI